MVATLPLCTKNSKVSTQQLNHPWRATTLHLKRLLGFLTSNVASGWFTSSRRLVCLSMTTMCSSSFKFHLLDLWGIMEDPMEGTCQLLTSFWTHTRFEGNHWKLINWSLPWTHPQGACILFCEYESIFLLQLETRVPVKYSCENNNGILIQVS
jgi:hypothetical protein